MCEAPAAAGYFSSSVSSLHTLPALVAVTNSAASPEFRVRSYLAANCAQCHQPGGSAQALWDARLTTTTAKAGLVNGALVNNLGDTNNRVLKPGSLANSALLTRISTRGAGQMPPLDSNLMDAQAVALVSAWITNDLPAFQTFAQWQLANFGSTNPPDAAANADPDGDGAKNQLEFLTGTSPTNALSSWKISAASAGGTPLVQFPQVANCAFEIQFTTNIFNTNSWQPLDVSGNEPFFAATNRAASVPDSPPAQPAKFFRVRVFEP